MAGYCLLPELYKAIDNNNREDMETLWKSLEAIIGIDASPAALHTKRKIGTACIRKVFQKSRLSKVRDCHYDTLLNLWKLVELGADVNDSYGDDGNPWLFCIVDWFKFRYRSGWPVAAEEELYHALITFVLQNGANPDAMVSNARHMYGTEERCCLLGYAARDLNWFLVKALLEAGANYNFRVTWGYDEMWLLSYVAQRDPSHPGPWMDVMKQFIATGADMSVL